MTTHKHFDKICCSFLAAILLLTLLFVNGQKLGVQASGLEMGYEARLFDTSRMHTIEIVMDDWDAFLDTCTNEEYANCTVVIDGEAYKNTGIRAKGNTSLTQVAAYGNNRYSFKLEFDHYNSQSTYYGLDKLCLNNLIQDNTYLKDYLVYQMMAQAGAAAPLCSFVNISVNGEVWGLYLAVEGIEEAFLTRSYGSDYGCLYKPDSMDMGGGAPDMDDFPDMAGSAPDMNDAAPDMAGGAPDMGDFPDMAGSAPDMNDAAPDMAGGAPDMGSRAMGSDDVLLKYIDDDPDSYPNIFDNAKTDITTADQNRLIASLKALSSGSNLTETVAIDQVIRYFVVHNFVLNFDSYTGSMIHNYYLYEEDGRLAMLPWDYNLAFGGFSTGTSAGSLVNYPIDTPVSGGDTADRPMLAWIFQNEEYTKLYHQYMEEFITEYFDSGLFSRQIDTLKELLSPYVAEDPTKFCTYEEFETGIDTLKEFCLLRSESISRQLEGSLGSTSDTQEAASLVDVGDLDISDMGTMQLTQNSPQKGAGRELPAGNFPGQGQMQDAAGGSFPEQGEVQDAAGGNFPGQGQMPNRADNSFPGQDSMSAAPWALLAASLIILAGGLIFAFLYRRK